MGVHLHFWDIHDSQNYILDGKHNVSPFNEEHTNGYWFNFLWNNINTDGEHKPFTDDVDDLNIKLKDYPRWKDAPITSVTNGQYYCIRAIDGSAGC